MPTSFESNKTDGLGDRAESGVEEDLVDHCGVEEAQNRTENDGLNGETVLTIGYPSVIFLTVPGCFPSITGARTATRTKGTRPAARKTRPRRSRTTGSGGHLHSGSFTTCRFIFKLNFKNFFQASTSELRCSLHVPGWPWPRQ